MKRLSLVMLALAGLSACGGPAPEIDAVAYEREILEWREGRLARLKAPTGYLNQIGLHWLDAGNYRMGSAPGNEIRLPSSAAAVIGELHVGDDGVRMTVADGVDVRSNDEPVRSILIADDSTDSPVHLSHSSFAWSIINRDGRFAVRVRDFAHPFVASFGPLPYFDIDPALRVNATLRRYDEPRIANVDTVIEGLGYHPQVPGVAEFEISGRTFELEAYQSGDRLFFVFGDATSRDATYGAGRFLYADSPDEEGALMLDFNKAYSPPCAFNDFSTCPVASPRNRLQIRIEAGEKFDPALHYSAEARP